MGKRNENLNSGITAICRLQIINKIRIINKIYMSDWWLVNKEYNMKMKKKKSNLWH